MRGWLVLLLWYGMIAMAWAEEPAIEVFCPAVAFDDRNDRGRNTEDSPHPVVLMVVGKTRQADDANSPTKKNNNDPADFRAGRRTQDFVVERVLFGSPPGSELRIEADFGGAFPDDADSVSHIYGFVSREKDGIVSYGRNDYYFLDRRYSIEQISQVEALAQARLDLLVLSSYAVFVGQPVAGTKQGEYLSVNVARVLHGPLKVGVPINVSRKENRPIPLTGGGPFVYFINRTTKADDGRVMCEVTTRWSIETVETVMASLSRSKNYPIQHDVDEYGSKTRQQEILFLGPRSSALELLQGHGKPLEILGARRILKDGLDAIDDVVKLVEKHLWVDKIDGQAGFPWQENLIRILGLLEEHRSDGHVVRLIDEVLTKAERGSLFPSAPPDLDDTKRRQSRWNYGRRLDSDSNHSLAWLLLTLDEKDAARLFGERLLKLREVAGYGWRDEAQFVIDLAHIEDHLELAKVEVRSTTTKPVRWQAGFQGEDLDHYRVAFSRDGKWFAAVDGVARIWDTADWSLAGEFKQSASVSEIAFSPDGESLFVAGGGAIAILNRWNWRTGTVAQRYPGHSSAVGDMQLSKDGKLLLTSNSYEGTMILFDSESGKVLELHPNEDWSDLRFHSNTERFLGRRKQNWWIGRTDKKDRQKLAFSALAEDWAIDGLWSLEEGAEVKAGSGESASDEALQADDDDNPFGGDIFGSTPRRLSVLRQRQLDQQQSVVLERPLPFSATAMIVSKDKKTVVILNDRQVEVFTAPEWKSVAAWKFPQRPRGSRWDPDTHSKHYQLSPDAKWVAVAEEHTFPKLFEIHTGQQVPLGPGHCNQIIAMNFADNDTVRTRDADGVVLRWNRANGEKLRASEADAADVPLGDDLWDRRRETMFVAEDGRTWRFKGEGGGPYGLYTSFEIQITAKGAEAGEDSDEKPGKETQVLGVIQPKWGKHEWLGLVPGGDYLHVGSQIFSRRDLKPVSAANVHGKIVQILFSNDGRKYALLTAEYQSRPAGLGYGVYQREQISQLLRVHNTGTGETLFAIPTNHVRLVAFSPDQSHLAVVNAGQQIEVWRIAE